MSYYHHAYYGGHGIAHMIISAVIHSVIWAVVWKTMRGLGLADSALLAVGAIMVIAAGIWFLRRIKST
ncbi:hypothetical protein BI364_10395 [Acidihalobacter yilgarnensis]|uniref:Uncharacterized protein n=1 Tax=Acidihalobacter yilgarnensis TaxID=2819280 RepID=A0A1D8IPB9_9GAMM|nr:hypothetical protein [Acidihalobacter yilgarnensis]AOU98316.1 hypothetical protein BI364_10395 [Acidihalobacter yilgarnensis]